jgi:hypothetical protein
MRSTRTQLSQGFLLCNIRRCFAFAALSVPCCYIYVRAYVRVDMVLYCSSFKVVFITRTTVHLSRLEER